MKTSSDEGKKTHIIRNKKHMKIFTASNLFLHIDRKKEI